MSKNSESLNIGQLLDNADELIQQINSDALRNLKEEHHLAFEKHAQKLKEIKSELQGKSGKKGTSGIGTGSEGMHEAILDIVKGMHDLKNRVF